MKWPNCCSPGSRRTASDRVGCRRQSEGEGSRTARHLGQDPVVRNRAADRPCRVRFHRRRHGACAAFARPGGRACVLRAGDGHGGAGTPARPPGDDDPAAARRRGRRAARAADRRSRDGRGDHAADGLRTAGRAGPGCDFARRPLGPRADERLHRAREGGAADAPARRLGFARARGGLCCAGGRRRDFHRSRRLVPVEREAAERSRGEGAHRQRI